MLCFETERLMVRHFNMDDLDALAALCNDREVMQYMGDGETLTREVCARWIDICQEKYRTHGYGTSGIFHRETGDFIGLCGVIRAPDHDFDEIIYALGHLYWGMGYGTEVAQGMLRYVFDISTLESIYATIHPENVVSQRMMGKLGMNFVEDKPNEDGSITRVYVIQRQMVVHGEK